MMSLADIQTGSVPMACWNMFIWFLFFIWLGCNETLVCCATLMSGLRKDTLASSVFLPRDLQKM